MAQWGNALVLPYCNLLHAAFISVAVFNSVVTTAYTSLQWDMKLSLTAQQKLERKKKQTRQILEERRRNTEGYQMCRD